MQLVRPSEEYLQGFLDALGTGWSLDTERGEDAAREEIAVVRKDPAGYLALQFDREAKGPPVRLPDGSQAPRIPGIRLWLWDGEFCGVIGFRWQPGTTALPPYCLGHIGYAVVPWKRRRGYATRALGQMLPIARQEGLPHVDITTDPGNIASRRVIEANGGTLVEQFTKPPEHGGKPALRYRIWFDAEVS